MRDRAPTPNLSAQPELDHAPPLHLAPVHDGSTAIAASSEIASRDAEEAEERWIDGLADGLAEHGWSEADALLPAEAMAGLVAGIRRRWEAGALEPAAVGRGEARRLQPEIRGDATRWWRLDALGPWETCYWARIEALRLGLNRRLFLGLAEFEAHDAVFPAGAHYHRHLDRFQDSDERSVSCLLYLNPGWDPAWGGQLRMHLPDGPRDIVPEAGRLLVFRSDTVWHEVLPADRARFSVAGWLRRRSFGAV